MAATSIGPWRKLTPMREAISPTVVSRTTSLILLKGPVGRKIGIEIEELTMEGWDLHGKRAMRNSHRHHWNGATPQCIPIELWIFNSSGHLPPCGRKLDSRSVIPGRSLLKGVFSTVGVHTTRSPPGRCFRGSLLKCVHWKELNFEQLRSK